MNIHYYNRDKLCTIIHWEKFQVSIQNFTDDIFERAFGRKEYVTWQDLEYFLASRCFPKSRANAKELLKELGLDYYDPFEIVKITKGRMAEDDQWLEFVEDKKND